MLSIDRVGRIKIKEGAEIFVFKFPNIFVQFFGPFISNFINERVVTAGSAIK